MTSSNNIEQRCPGEPNSICLKSVVKWCYWRWSTVRGLTVWSSFDTDDTVSGSVFHKHDKTLSSQWSSISWSLDRWSISSKIFCFPLWKMITWIVFHVRLLSVWTKQGTLQSEWCFLSAPLSLVSALCNIIERVGSQRYIFLYIIKYMYIYVYLLQNANFFKMIN